MKRISITRGFLAIIVVFAMIVGGVCAFVFINPNVVGLLSSGNRITISTDDYNQLIEVNERYREAEELRTLISSNFYTEVDEEQIDEYVLKGIVAGLGDIYSSYYNAEEYKDILASLTGEYYGIGVTMMRTDDGIKVTRVHKDSPAAEGGVTVGEYILSVDDTDFTADELDLVAAAIRGKSGTKVRVTFYKNGKQIEREFTRRKVIVDTIESKMLEDNIGYIKIESFESGTYDDFKSALSSLSSADGLIIDLRDNPGGLVDSAINIADELMDRATMIYTEDHNGDRQFYNTKAGTSWDKPVVLLVNENSASASEILAVGLKENDRVSIVGTTTFGKGVIQSLEEMKDGGALKLTMWEYFSPSGQPIHRVGVEPDVVVELSDDDYDEYRNIINDVQLDAAISELKSEIQ